MGKRYTILQDQEITVDIKVITISLATINGEITLMIAMERITNGVQIEFYLQISENLQCTLF